MVYVCVCVLHVCVHLEAMLFRKNEKPQHLKNVIYEYFSFNVHSNHSISNPKQNKHELIHSFPALYDLI